MSFQKLTRSGWMYLWISLVVIGIDRFSKLWMLHHLTPYESLRILPIFNFTLAYNKGAAFSFLRSASGWQNIFLASIAFAVSFVILYYLAKSSIRDRFFNISLCLILGGALGNVWDRLQYGYVIDFLHFHLSDWHFAIFNIADSAICIGTFMLIGYWFTSGKTD